MHNWRCWLDGIFSQTLPHMIVPRKHAMYALQIILVHAVWYMYSLSSTRQGRRASSQHGFNNSWSQQGLFTVTWKAVRGAVGSFMALAHKASVGIGERPGALDRCCTGAPYLLADGHRLQNRRSSLQSCFPAHITALLQCACVACCFSLNSAKIQ